MPLEPERNMTWGTVWATAPHLRTQFEVKRKGVVFCAQSLCSQSFRHINLPLNSLASLLGFCRATRGTTVARRAVAGTSAASRHGRSAGAGRETAAQATGSDCLSGSPGRAPPAQLMVEALCLAGCWKVPVHGGLGDDIKQGPTIAAWLVCRGWRDALRGSVVHLAAALIAAHGPEQALVRAVRCKSAHTQPLALVQEVLRQCGQHLPCLEPAFIEAGKRGFDDIMRLLLQQPGDLKPDCRDGAALVAASLEGQEHVVRTLLEWPENAPKAYCQNYQALHEASCNGHHNVVKLLLLQPPPPPPDDTDLDADFNAVDRHQESFDVAAVNGHHRVVRELLTAPHNPVAADSGDSYGLLSAARNGHLAVVRLLLKWPVNAPRADCRDCEALTAAAAHGLLEMVKLLLSWPVNAPRADCGGSHQAVLQAAAKGHLDVVRLLLTHPTNASPANAKESKVLVHAASSGNKRLVQMLLAWPVDAPEADGEGKRNTGAPLIAAAEGGHLEVVRLLLKAGARSGLDKAFEAAAKGGHAKVAKLLLGWCASQPAAKPLPAESFSKALLEAVRGEQPEFVHWLLSLPRCSPRPSASGRQLFVAAVCTGCTETVRALMHAPHHRLRPHPPVACEALQAAAHNGHLHMVNFLLQLLMGFKHKELAAEDSGGVPGEPDCKGGYRRGNWREEDVLRAAARRGHTDVVRTLLAAWPLQPGEPQGNAAARREQVESALLAAVRHDATDCVRVLLQWDHPDAPRADCREGGAICEAARFSSVSMARFLLTYPRHAPRADAKEGQALIEALHSGSEEMVRLLLEWPEHAPSASCQNGAALTAAVCSHAPELVQLVLEAPQGGARADLGNGEALMEACRYGNLAIVRMLLTSPHPPAPDCRDGTAVVAAAKRGHDDVLELLLGWEGEGAPSADVQDGEALIAAAGSGQLSTMIMLLTWPSRAPRADVRGGAALLAAVRSRSVDAVRLLLDWPEHAPRADMECGRALVEAVENHCPPALLRLLLDRPYDAPRPDVAIDKALKRRDVRLLNVLLEAGPDKATVEAAVRKAKDLADATSQVLQQWLASH